MKQINGPVRHIRKHPFDPPPLSNIQPFCLFLTVLLSMLLMSCCVCVQGLLADVVKQISGPQPDLSPNTPWRIMGLFPSSCLVCRAVDVCGAISCAEKVRVRCVLVVFAGTGRPVCSHLFISGLLSFSSSPFAATCVGNTLSGNIQHAPNVSNVYRSKHFTRRN